MKLFTIGFTETTAQNFFDRLRFSNVQTVIDTRLNRHSQLSGFAKVPDLQFFLQQLAKCSYEAVANLAPTSNALKNYRSKVITWEEYSIQYNTLLQSRLDDLRNDISSLHLACLLCSEHKPDKCHRKLAAEFIKLNCSFETPLEIVHL